MKKTILCHFYNEEYLLPFWLNHHKKIFTDGIMVDYDSTDNSVDIIKEICPTWKIVKSRNKLFGATVIDSEITDYEKNIEGFRICLNVTEFILGDFKSLDSKTDNTRITIPPLSMFDHPDMMYKEVGENIFTNRTWGIDYSTKYGFYLRRARSLHNFHSGYPLGRHFESYNTHDFAILWYNYSPFNEETIKRKLQIKDKMPEQDKRLGLGIQHLRNRDEIFQYLKENQTNPNFRNLDNEINRLLKLTFE